MKKSVIYMAAFATLGLATSCSQDAQTLTDFSPNTAASDKKDFVYTSATGNGSSNVETGTDLNFKHALTEISIDAKNTSSDKGNYETTWTEGVTLGGEVSKLDKSNVPFMIIPQTLTSTTKYADGNYIAMKVKITMQGSKVLHDGWAYIGIDTNWDMGKHYVYTLDFSNGAVQDDNGKDIISDKNIKLNVSVTPWDEKSAALPQKLISGTVNNTSPFNISINGEKIQIAPDSNGNWKYNIAGINVTNMFYNSTSLTSLDLSNWNTRNVTNMSAMFSSCNKLKTIYVDNCDEATVKKR